jgi:hypothetical protein
MIGWGMSATSNPHATRSEILLLVIGPVMALTALGFLSSFGDLTSGKMVALFVPATLSVLELVFAFAVWNATVT